MIGEEAAAGQYYLSGASRKLAYKKAQCFTLQPKLKMTQEVSTRLKLKGSSEDRCL